MTDPRPNHLATARQILTVQCWTLWVSLCSALVPLHAASFVGKEQCVDCHLEQTQAWQGSHHDMAMRHAKPDAVLGDFNDVTMMHNGKAHRFYQKGDEYWVTLEGPKGEMQDHQILYTFGFEPLQQYMVAFEDGRVQLIPYAWDSRPKSQGGQRWFHLYPDTKPHDEFYWTNTGQNWNFMCADCHSTNLKKNYDAESNRYNTTWSEINVGCEACHGPGSEHVEQATQYANQPRSEWSKHSAHLGFDRDLGQSVANWVYQEGHSTLQPEAIVPTAQVQTCAQCHSRRTQLNETGDHVNGSFFDKYRLSLITPELYHHDGQIYDEDYVYGSFLQSQMARKGVACSNCHDPHSATLKVAEEAVCAQCHLASDYTPEKHTFHAAGSQASKCTTCHMPETTYMQVDPRRDHSWHVPRADIAKHIGTPNVCTSCHTDQSAQWADEQVAAWFPESPYRNQQHFAVAFYADEIGHQGSADALAYSAQDASLAPIIRASALERMAGNQSQNTLISLARAVKHDNEMIRLGAIEGASGYEFGDQWKILSPLLSDPVLAVRTEAAAALVSGYLSMNAEQKAQLKPALEEYIEIQRFNADRGFGRVNLGNVHRQMGDSAQAERLYQQAIELEPYFENSYINLADLYRTQGDESKAREVLLSGLTAQPSSSIIPYSLGLSLLRSGDRAKANDYLAIAAKGAQTNAQYWYVYGLALEGSDVMAASQALNQAYQVGGNPQHLYAQCEVLARNRHSAAVDEALKACLGTLAQVVPAEVVGQLRARLGLAPQ
ncbi:multiheme c-type cytochrome [Vibrio scophthalmi]|uniref:multiheme c-type cytochrome n=1 Tax=Vibrio scophthalmi TaxID=45658 RepID=UPI002FF37944